MLYVCLSIQPTKNSISIDLSIYLSIDLSMYLSIDPFMHQVIHVVFMHAISYTKFMYTQVVMTEPQYLTPKDRERMAEIVFESIGQNPTNHIVAFSSSSCSFHFIVPWLSLELILLF